MLLSLALGAALAALVALATVGVGSAEAAFPGGNGKIVFSSDRVTATNLTGDDEIFTMNKDGTDIEQLTFNTTPDNQPAFFHDGNWIAYVGYPDGDAEIYMRTYGGDLTFEFPLTNNTAFDLAPAWSPDGRKIAFTSSRDGDPEIYTMKARPEGETNRPTNLTKYDSALDYKPDWQPLVN